MGTVYHQQQVDAEYLHGPYDDDLFHGPMLVGQETSSLLG